MKSAMFVEFKKMQNTTSQYIHTYDLNYIVFFGEKTHQSFYFLGG
jgi:hypothetical protein